VQFKDEGGPSALLAKWKAEEAADELKPRILEAVAPVDTSEPGSEVQQVSKQKYISCLTCCVFSLLQRRGGATTTPCRRHAWPG